MSRMKPSVYFWSFRQESPRGFGMVPLGTGTMIKLTPEGLVEGYGIDWDRRTGRCRTFNKLQRPFDWWTANHNQIRDVRMQRLLETMQEVGNAGNDVSDHLPLPVLLAEVEADHHIDLDSQATRDLILWAIGPDYEGAATPGVSSLTGGTIVEYGHLHDSSGRKFVGLDTGEALVFPVSARIYPWVKIGVKVDPSVAMADMVPRTHYTWEQFMGFGDHIVSQVIDDVIESSTFVEDGRSFVDFRLVPENNRGSQQYGGYVKSVVEVVDENRKPALVKGDRCSDDVGDYEFVQANRRGFRKVVNS